MTEAKICTKCSVLKPFVDFYACSRVADGRRATCKSCMLTYQDSRRPEKKKYDAEYRLRDYVAEKEQERQSSPAYRAAKAIYDRLYYKQNAEHKRLWFKRYYAVNASTRREYSRNFAAVNKGFVTAYARRYYETHKADFLAYSSARRARAKLATPAWVDRQAISKIYADATWLSEALGCPLHVDHIVPLNSPVVCGLHVEHNLQILDAKKNLIKSNRLIEESL